MNQLFHLVREVAIVGAELEVEVDHGELGARLHPAREERPKFIRYGLYLSSPHPSMSHSNLSINISVSAQITWCSL